MRRVIALLLAWSMTSPATTYYVSNSGSDAANGTSTGTPWQTISKVNGSTFSPGDSILFSKGGVWREQLVVPSSGTSGNPITFGSYGTGAQPIINGANLVTGTWTQTPAASGPVTQANMRMSVVNGSAFVDFNSAGVFSGYTGNLLTITDHAGKKLTGYIKAAGTGETYGSELLSNTDFANTTGVTIWFNATVASVAGGQSGNALQLTQTSGGFGQAYQTFTTVNGGLYRGSVYMKFGTETSLMGWSFFTPGPGSAIRTQNAAPSTFTNYPLYFSAAGTSYLQSYTANTDATTSLFDTATVKQVLTPSITGVTITSTSNGSTFNWASEDAGFNRNDSSGYTYTIAGSGSAANIWQIALPTQPKLVAFNGTPNIASSSLAAVSAANQWYWASNILYIYSAADPSTAFTTPGVEAGNRVSGITLNSKDYVTIQGLEVELANSQGVTSNGTADNGITVDSSTIYYNGGAGISAFDTSNGWVISNNTVSYNGGGQGLGLSSGDNICAPCSATATGSGFQVFNNTVANAYGDGIYVGGTGQSIHNNVISNSGNNGFGYGIELICSNTDVYGNDVSGSQASYSAVELNGGNNNSVHHNIIHGNAGSGITLSAGVSTAAFNVVYGHTATNTMGILLNGGNGSLVANNTLYGNYIGLELYATTTSATIKNNLVVGNNTVGVGFASGAAGTLSFNDVYGNTSANYFGLTDPTGTNSNVSVNPLFTNTATNDFSISRTSPARNVGTVISGFAFPYGVPDLGALPYYAKSANSLAF